MLPGAMRFLPFVLCLLAACAHLPDQLERYRALSQPSKDLYDRYHQFLTTGQQERFLTAESDEVRQRFIADLHIEERLARYPKYVQDAIWSREVVPGMDKAAVLLAWGRPDQADREDTDHSRGVQQEVWTYVRGPQLKDDYRVTIVEGVVTTVEKP